MAVNVLKGNVHMYILTIFEAYIIVFSNLIKQTVFEGV